MSLREKLDEAPGSVCLRHEVPTPVAYAVFDCETTGTSPDDEIVSLAAIRVNGAGAETGRLARLICPGRPIPPEATDVHGISDEDVASAPRFAEIAPELLELLDDAIFVAHNARFDLAMLQHAFAGADLEYEPGGVACTLNAFRLLEPLAFDHRLESICETRGIALVAAHDALGDAAATAALLRLLLNEGIAPETVKLDHGAFMHLRSRGDKRAATTAQIRRVFALGYAAGLPRDGILALVAQLAGTSDADALTREQVQDVYDALERLTPRSIERAA